MLSAAPLYRNDSARCATEERHASQTITQERDDAGRKRPIASMSSRLGDCHPDQWTTDRVTVVEQVEQTADLVAVPDVATLEFGQRHKATADMIQDRRNLHALPPSINFLFRSIAISIALIFWFRSTRWPICFARAACARN